MDARHFEDARMYERGHVTDSQYLSLQEIVTGYCKNLERVTGVRGELKNSFANIVNLPRLTSIGFHHWMFKEPQTFMEILEKLPNKVQSVDAKRLLGRRRFDDHDFDMEEYITRKEKPNVLELSVNRCNVLQIFRADHIRKLAIWTELDWTPDTTCQFIAALPLCRNLSQVELNLELIAIYEEMNFPLLVSTVEALPKLESLSINIHETTAKVIKQFIDICPQIRKYVKSIDIHSIVIFHSPSGKF